MEVQQVHLKLQARRTPHQSPHWRRMLPKVTAIGGQHFYYQFYPHYSTVFSSQVMRIISNFIECKMLFLKIQCVEDYVAWLLVDWKVNDMCTEYRRWWLVARCSCYAFCSLSLSGCVFMLFVLVAMQACDFEIAREGAVIPYRQGHKIQNIFCVKNNRSLQACRLLALSMYSHMHCLHTTNMMQTTWKLETARTLISI